MKKLLKYLRNYKKEAVIGPLFKMLEASFELLVPVVMARIIDIGIKNGDTAYIWRMCVLMIGLGVLGLVCSLTAQYFAAKAALGFASELRLDLYRHINTFSFHELDQIGTSTLVTRMTSDVNQVQNGVNLVLRLFLRSPFIVIGAVFMAFTISPRLTLIFLAAVPLLGLVIFLVVRITMPIYRKVQQILDQIVRISRENYVGTRVVRAFSRQEGEVKEFNAAAGELKTTQMRAGRIAAVMNPATYVLVNLAVICILVAGVYQVDSGAVTQGEIIALVNYMTQILTALVALANLIVSVTKALASASRVSAVFDVQAGMSDEGNRAPEEKPGAPKVAFRGVTFTYDQAREASLTDISFEVMPGETVGVIGATGSGKTTLISLIPRFYDCQEGMVEVDGTDVRDYPFSVLRRKIGLVPQKAMLFAGTIRQNMQWGDDTASDAEIRKALMTAQALEFVDQKPGGLDARVAPAGRNFSGGQRQRLTIARALAANPEILILDDSASALDYATDAALRRAIRENTRNMTVFLVSQRVATVMSADQILVIDDGRLAGAGTHEELFRSCAVYREICQSQLSGEEVARYGQ